VASLVALFDEFQPSDKPARAVGVPTFSTELLPSTSVPSAVPGPLIVFWKPRLTKLSI
jgi:hypothetical protein